MCLLRNISWVVLEVQAYQFLWILESASRGYLALGNGVAYSESWDLTWCRCLLRENWLLYVDGKKGVTGHVPSALANCEGVRVGFQRVHHSCGGFSWEWAWEVFRNKWGRLWPVLAQHVIVSWQETWLPSLSSCSFPTVDSRGAHGSSLSHAH